MEDQATYRRNGNGNGSAKTADLSNYVFGKVQPQAIPLEGAVLGALMLERDALMMVADLLTPETFYLNPHQNIYRAIIRLFEAQSPIDLLTVTEQMRKDGTIETVDGGYYLVELSHQVASSANIEYHARILAQKHIQRQLIVAATETIRDAYEDATDAFALLEKTEVNLFKIGHRKAKSAQHVRDITTSVIMEAERAMQYTGECIGIPSGIRALDKETGGWRSPDLVIIAGRPAMGKCLGKGTMVLMYDGSLVKVEDIKQGDILMGPDSKPRNVLSIARGREQMYWVRQNRGIDYRVNESHILSLKRSGSEGSFSHGEVLNISVRHFLNKSDRFKEKFKGYKTGIEFTEKFVSISPYFLGLWLGDGSADSSTISNPDVEVFEYLNEYAVELGMSVSKYHNNPEKCPQYRITGGKTGGIGYSLQAELRRIGVLNNKHIPENYLINTSQKRLQLLAGLLDTDGHYLKQSNGFEIMQKSEALARQIKFLCDSLGFRTSIYEKQSGIKSIGFAGTYWRVRIYGDIDKIPVRIKRKKGKAWGANVDWQVTGIKVEKDIVDDYYGFEIDGDRLFLLEDMTVTHNTALALTIAKGSAKDGTGVAFFSLEMSKAQLVQRLVCMEGKVNGQMARNGKLTQDDFRRMCEAQPVVDEMPIYIEDTPAMSVIELRAAARRLKMKHNIGAVIVDYLQLMRGGEDQRGNREREIAQISGGLKALAKELEVPVIALAQLSRAVEVRGGSKRPQMSDLRESGAIENDADIILFPYRPEYYQITEDEEGNSLAGVAELIIGKNRHGRSGISVMCGFDEFYALFRDLDEKPSSQFPATAPQSGASVALPEGASMRGRNEEDIPF